MVAPKSFAFTVLLGLLAALPVLSIDVSAPTLVLIPAALSTSPTVAGLTLSLFMVGFALGQFGGGSLSDRKGRRPVLLTGLGCFTMAGIACTLSQSGGALTLFRLIQGCGAGACSVVSFAMVQDLFEGESARIKRAYMTVIFGAAPILAPALGAVLSSYAGWRSVHGALAMAGAALFAVTWVGVEESRRRESETLIPFGSMAPKGLREDTRFIGIATANALSYGAVFAYVAGAPVVIIGQMGRASIVFSGVFAGTTAALTMGAWLSGYLSRRGIGSFILLDPSIAVASVGAIALAAACFSGQTSGTVLVPILMVVLFARGLIAPNMMHLAIDRQRERAGEASAVVGISQLLVGAAAGAAVAGLLPSMGPSGVAVPMALLSTASLIVWHVMRSRGGADCL